VARDRVEPSTFRFSLGRSYAIFGLPPVLWVGEEGGTIKLIGVPGENGPPGRIFIPLAVDSKPAGRACIKCLCLTTGKSVRRHLVDASLPPGSERSSDCLNSCTC
jgi:hypothetical protein